MDGKEIDSALRKLVRGLNPNPYRVTTAHGHPNSKNKGQIMAHRLVMSERIGRPLMEHENVHHLNGIRYDNRPENLELWTVSQPGGQRVSDKISWAKEFLLQYGYIITDPVTSSVK